ncbi:hypothetical protein AA0117_g1902 [Alternaria alternata]|uniref:Uncharacterized protein n=1 Tax=Alternaria alternata TaxID=5599 RepID=A0A4Q4NR04_ALTAL|nr:hypothetical protein AA0117_g1902 [Alternaria alternata]
MYFSSVFSFAVLASVMSAVAIPAALQARGHCGDFYDNHLGPGTAGAINGGKQCQNFRKPGESPNDQSTYTMRMNGVCLHCDFYFKEDCNDVSYGMGSTRGLSGNEQKDYRIAKSFRC